MFAMLSKTGWVISKPCNDKMVSRIQKPPEKGHTVRPSSIRFELRHIPNPYPSLSSSFFDPLPNSEGKGIAALHQLSDKIQQSE